MRNEFSAKTKRDAFLRADGRCEDCHMKLSSGHIEYDHQIADYFTKDNSLENCVVRCKTCHKLKTTKQDIPRIAKTKRQQANHLGFKRQKKKIPYRKFDGTPVWPEHNT